MRCRQRRISAPWADGKPCGLWALRHERRWGFPIIVVPLSTSAFGELTTGEASPFGNLRGRPPCCYVLNMAQDKQKRSCRIQVRAWPLFLWHTWLWGGERVPVHTQVRQHVADVPPRRVPACRPPGCTCQGTAGGTGTAASFFGDFHHSGDGLPRHVVAIAPAGQHGGDAGGGFAGLLAGGSA